MSGQFDSRLITTFIKTSQLVATSVLPKKKLLPYATATKSLLVQSVSARRDMIEPFYGRIPGMKRKTEILRMDPADWAHLPIGTRELTDIPLLQRRGEVQGVWTQFSAEERAAKYNHVDRMIFVHQDIDLRPIAVRRWFKGAKEFKETRLQDYNPERNRILGNELAVAHFIVFRKGKVKFFHQPEWITKYRTDAKGDEEEIDLAPITQDVCTLPTKYEPNYRLEAIDCSGLTVMYNGLANFDGLHNLAWLSFRGSDRRFDDWCLDRIYGQFEESLEYLDLSECQGITERGLAGAWRLKHLQTLVVEGLSHIKNLEIVCSMLEDKIPGLTCIGVDYERKAAQLKEENDAIERLEAARLAGLEASTINVVPQVESDFESSPPPSDTEHVVEQQTGKIKAKI